MQRDTLRAAGLVLGSAVTAVTPRAIDPWIVRKLVRLFYLVRPASPVRLADRMARTLDREASSLRDAVRELYAMGFGVSWARARAQRRGAWRPSVEIEGLDRLHASRERGAGTILWRTHFCGTLVTKYALHEHGIPLVHLSMEVHPATSDVWAARHILAPLYQRVENRYLAERVVIPRAGTPVSAMRRLIACLGENRVVSIRGDWPGTQAVATPFFDRYAHFAIGAPSLAVRTGATLLPTHVVWEDVDRYRVVIGEPIQLADDDDRRTRIEGAVRDFAARMEAAIRAHPASWMEWGVFWGDFPPYSRQSTPP